MPTAPFDKTGSGELGLLASGNTDATAAGKPLYFEARVRAAAAVKDPAIRSDRGSQRGRLAQLV